MVLVVAVHSSFSAIIQTNMGLLRHICNQLLPSIRGHDHVDTASVPFEINGLDRQYLQQSRLSIVRGFNGGVCGDISTYDLGIVTA